MNNRRFMGRIAQQAALKPLDHWQGQEQVRLTAIREIVIKGVKSRRSVKEIAKTLNRNIDTRRPGDPWYPREVTKLVESLNKTSPQPQTTPAPSATHKPRSPKRTPLTVVRAGVDAGKTLEEIARSLDAHRSTRHPDYEYWTVEEVRAITELSTFKATDRAAGRPVE